MEKYQLKRKHLGNTVSRWSFSLQLPQMASIRDYITIIDTKAFVSVHLK